MEKLHARRLAISIIVLPVLLAVFYYLFLAADRYVSEAQLTVSQSSDSGSEVPGIAVMLSGVNPPSRQETLYLREYIQSLDMLKLLDEELGLRAAYSAESLDLLFRLPESATQEEFLEYYRARVQVNFDETTGLLALSVQGFKPDFAQAMAQAIVRQSERFVNEISHGIAREQMAFAEGEVISAGKRFQAAKAKLISFQNKNRVLNPLTDAQARAGLASELENQIAQAEAELLNMQTYLNDGAHQVVAQRNLIKSLRSQLDSEKRRVAAPEGSRLNTLVSEFRDLELGVVFAEDAYKVALAAAENARIEANRKLRTVVLISSPSLPEEAKLPQRIYNLLSLLVLMSLLYGISRFIVATIEDHRD